MINLGFWKDIHEKAAAAGRPLYVLAPMADVTDCAFRKLINKYGKPDVTWTEFVAADGIVRATPEGKAKLMRDLIYNVRDVQEGDGSAPDAAGAYVSERPIVAQLFSSHPEYMEMAARLVAELGYDGIDINMGCPDKGIEKQGCGSAMIKTPKVAAAVIEAAKRGGVRKPSATFNDDPELIARFEAGDAAALVHLPVTVKTRIGYSKDELETWLPALLRAEPAAVTIHARTRKEMSKVPARWEDVKRAVQIRDEFFMQKKARGEWNEGEDRTLILGNGDITSIADAYEKGTAAGADGVMLGRAIFGNPWLFRNLDSKITHAADEHHPLAYDPLAYLPSVSEKLRVMAEHTEEYERHLGDIKSFAIMKKHYKAYVHGFDGAKELRAELMEHAQNAADVRRMAEDFLASQDMNM